MNIYRCLRCSAKFYAAYEYEAHIRADNCASVADTIRRLMPEDHDPSTCRICRFLAEPCANCGQLHVDYGEAASCMRRSSAAYNQYIAASLIKE